LKHVREGSERPVLVPAMSDEQEAEFIAQRILELREEGVPMREVAVLFRAAYHSQALEFELTKRDIPYDFRGGVRFFDRAHIKDTLAYLKVVDNPRDEVSFRRVLRHQVGIGDQTASQIFEAVQSHMREADERHVLEPVFEEMSVASRGEKGWQTLRSTLEALIGDRHSGPETLIRLVMDSDYKEYLRNQYTDSDDRLEDLEQLATFASKYDEVSKFLSEVSLQEEFGVVGGGEDKSSDERIVLSTIHQAKGLEWRAVFVIHLSDAYFPNPKALAEGGLEEERRLFYVAITRSKEYLYLSYSLSSGYRTMSMHLNAPSQFISEVPDTLLESYRLSEETNTDVDALIDPDQVIELDEDGGPKGLLDRVLKTNEEKRERRNRNASSWIKH
jgi:DNA helicase-2/ATP-dependent DNA helicase PcrA